MSTKYLRYEAVYSNEKMKSDYNRLVASHPGRIPLVINLPMDLQPNLPTKPGKPLCKYYLIEPSDTLQHLMIRIRESLKVNSSEAIILLWKDCMEPNSKTIGDIYQERKHVSGVLIADLCKENAFGSDQPMVGLERLCGGSSSESQNRYNC